MYLLEAALVAHAVPEPGEDGPCTSIDGPSGFPPRAGLRLALLEILHRVPDGALDPGPIVHDVVVPFVVVVGPLRRNVLVVVREGLGEELCPGGTGGGR